MIQASHILCFDFRRGAGGIGGVATSDDTMWKQDGEAGQRWALEHLGQPLPKCYPLPKFFESIPQTALTTPLPEGLVLNAWGVADAEAWVLEDYSPNNLAPGSMKPEDLFACGWRSLGWDICATGFPFIYFPLSYLYTYADPWPGAPQHLRHRLNAMGLIDNYEECVEIINATDFSRYDPVDYIPVQLISTLGRAQA